MLCDESKQSDEFIRSAAAASDFFSRGTQMLADFQRVCRCSLWNDPTIILINGT